jgi:hypothetical protein
MSLLLFIILPALCGLLGKLLGLAVAATTFFTPAGKDLGRAISGWCVPLLPVVILVLMAAGARGNAAHGFSLFGSLWLFEVVCLVVFYAVPVLGVYVGLLYVTRDLTLGQRTR